MNDKNMCKGCLHTKKKDDTDCTLFEDKTRAELIDMFNVMLKYYGFQPIKENETSKNELTTI